MLTPRPTSRTVNSEIHVLDSTHGRILCIADIRGRLSALNDLAREHNAAAIISTGDFGFFEAGSIERINDRTLRHLTMYSPLIPAQQRTHLLASDTSPTTIRQTITISLLSEFPLLLSGQIKLTVPVYAVWGACEDVQVVEKLRLGAYKIDNLHVLDEATTRVLDVGGIKMRLLGLGGALVSHKFFDNGEGKATIAGAGGTMWTTALQIGELVDTAQRVFDPSETRLFVSHASPGREGTIAQLALVLKADLTISAGLHFRYATSYNEFSVQPDFDGFRRKLEQGKDSFNKIWENVKTQVDVVIDDNQRVLLDKALSVTDRLPASQPSTGPGATATGDEPAWKNCWNWNLCDAAYGTLVFDIKEGRVSSELKSQGFNYAYRRTATTSATPLSATSALPNNLPSKGTTPGPPSADTSQAAPDTSASTEATPAEAPVTRSANGTPGAGGKKKEKKERKERGADKDGTPRSTATPNLPEAASPAPTGGDVAPKSPVADGSPSGVKTPKTARLQRHPWTIFMRLQVQTQDTFPDSDVKAFFGEAGEKIMKIHWPNAPAGRLRFTYIEFEDEESMRLGIEKHGEKLKDHPVDVKQATDRESRGETSHRGGHPGRGRGRGTGSYAARGFAAAGLTRGGFNRGSGDAGNTTNSNNGNGEDRRGSNAGVSET